MAKIIQIEVGPNITGAIAMFALDDAGQIYTREQQPDGSLKWAKEIGPLDAPVAQSVVPPVTPSVSTPS